MASKLPTVKDTYLPTGLVDPSAAARLSAADSMEIHELIHRVYFAEDSRNYDALRAAFTEDAIHDHSLYGRVQGSEAIVAFVQANLEQGFNGIRHHALNVVTAQTGEDTAEALSYVMPFKLFPASGEDDAGKLPRIIGQGVVRDRLVKVEGRWRISHRTYDQFSVSPDFVSDAAVLNKASQSLE